MNTSSKMSAQKKSPQRSCCGCREQFDKADLARVLRTPEGNITLDRTGRANGRGAYLCPNANCLKLARKARRLERNLKAQIPEEVYTALEEELGGAEK